MISLHIQKNKAILTNCCFLLINIFTVHCVSFGGKDFLGQYNNINNLVHVHIHSKNTRAAGETSDLEIVQDFTLYHNAKKMMVRKCDFAEDKSINNVNSDFDVTLGHYFSLQLCTFSSYISSGGHLSTVALPLLHRK